MMPWRDSMKTRRGSQTGDQVSHRAMYDFIRDFTNPLRSARSYSADDLIDTFILPR